ncbi:MAG: ribonuclease Z [Gemmiger sp.]|nr:ribonuclease Z [Gemmiger sp.]
MVDITLLGCGGTQPLPDRALASLCITTGGTTTLIDCGEGTQAAARRWGISIFKIDAVLLTHFHGDHIFGIPGLWQTMAGLSRTAPLLMAGPPGLDALLQTFYRVAGPLPFAIRTVELAGCRGSFAVPGGLITAFPAKHRVPCCGYRYTLPRAGRFDPARARAAQIPLPYWGILQKGECVGGFAPADVLGPPRRGIQVVYATDTRPCAAVANAAADADLLCMDATYAGEEDAAKAKLYGHATCRQAGQTAAKAGVRRLWLTHYSAAVVDTAPGLAAAQAVFPTAEAGFDGKRVSLNFDEETPK